MPKPIYDDSIPADSRWCWVATVPESWRSVDPTVISSRVMAVLNDALIGWNGSPAEISFGQYQGEPAIFFNADDDPSGLFVKMVEPPPTVAETEVAEATARLQSVKAGTYAGTRDALIDDLVTVMFPETSSP